MPCVVDSRPPLPEIQLLEEATFSGHDRIVATGVDEYIATYGEVGWLRALNDGRVLRPCGVTADAATKRLGNGRSVFRFPLRVKDVFCFYFLQHKGTPLGCEWRSDGTWKQRDAVVSAVLSEIKRRPASRRDKRQ